MADSLINKFSTFANWQRRRFLEHFVIEKLSESSGARLISALLIRKALRANG